MEPVNHFVRILITKAKTLVQWRIPCSTILIYSSKSSNIHACFGINMMCSSWRLLRNPLQNFKVRVVTGVGWGGTRAFYLVSKMLIHIQRPIEITETRLDFSPYFYNTPSYLSNEMQFCPILGSIITRSLLT